MRSVAFILLLLIVFACDTTRNTPDPQDNYFLRYYGGAGYQEAIDIVTNEDGSIVMLGQTRTTQEASAQVYLVKVTKSGFVQWEKTFGTDELAKDIELSLNGYLVLSDSLHDNVSDILVRVLNEDGELIQKSSSFSYPGNFNEAGSTVTQLYDNGSPAGFIATGYTDAPNDGTNSFQGKTAIFIRFNQNGTPYTQAWINYTGTEGDDIGIRVAQVDQSLSSLKPFFFFGYFNGQSQDDLTNHSYNFWISSMSATGGGSIGTQIVMNSPTTDERLSNVTAMNSLGNSFLLAGTTSNTTSDKIFLASQNGGPGTQTLDIDLGNLQILDESYKNVSIIPSYRSGYLVAANHVVVDNSDIILTKLDASGNNSWENVQSFGGNGNDKQTAVLELSNGRILLFGTMELGADKQSKMFLMKLNSKGQLME